MFNEKNTHPLGHEDSTNAHSSTTDTNDSFLAGECSLCLNHCSLQAPACRRGMALAAQMREGASLEEALAGMATHGRGESREGQHGGRHHHGSPNQRGSGFQPEEENHEPRHGSGRPGLGRHRAGGPGFAPENFGPHHREEPGEKPHHGFGHGPRPGRNLDEAPRDVRLAHLLHRAAMLLGRDHHGFGRHGQRRILELLGGNEGMSQRELTDKAQIRPASLSELLGKLERHGFISRERDEADRRNMRVKLTPEGQTHLEQELAPDRPTPFSLLDETEQEQLETLLRKLTQAWAAHGDQGLEHARGRHGFGHGPHREGHRSHNEERGSRHRGRHHHGEQERHGRGRERGETTPQGAPSFEADA